MLTVCLNQRASTHTLILYLKSKNVLKYFDVLPIILKKSTKARCQKLLIVSQTAAVIKLLLKHLKQQGTDVPRHWVSELCHSMT